MRLKIERFTKWINGATLGDFLKAFRVQLIILWLNFQRIMRLWRNVFFNKVEYNLSTEVLTMLEITFPNIFFKICIYSYFYTFQLPRQWMCKSFIKSWNEHQNWAIICETLLLIYLKGGSNHAGRGRSIPRFSTTQWRFISNIYAPTEENHSNSILANHETWKEDLVLWRCGWVLRQGCSSLPLRWNRLWSPLWEWNWRRHRCLGCLLHGWRYQRLYGTQT